MPKSALKWLLVVLAVGAAALLWRWPRAPRGAAPRPQSDRPAVRLRDVGPRFVSNQTSQPLALYGRGFTPGLRLVLGPPFSRELPLSVLDDGHAYARLPADLPLPPDVSQQLVPLSLRGAAGGSADGVSLTVVNDAAFPDLIALARSDDGRFVFAASSTTDTVFAIEPATRRVTPIKVGDGPAALATWGRWLVVAHTFSPELRLVHFDGTAVEQESLPAPAYAAGLTVDPGSGTAYVAEHARDTVSALDLAGGGRVLWTSRVLPNPRELAVAGDVLAVGSLQAGQLQLLDRASGKELARTQPEPGIPILGGRTEAWRDYVMGGRAARALAFSRRCGQLLVSSVGPNVGPNPDRMEVSMNGGISTVSLEKAPRFLRHLGFGAGVPEGVALDDGAGLLYSADIALGRVRVVDARRLCVAPGAPPRARASEEAAARAAVLQELPIAPPAGFPTVRPPEDFGVNGRAGLELHSGPRALVLSPDARTLYALDRFTGTLAVIDVRGAARGQAAVVEQIPVVATLAQRARRLGQVLYYADLGRTGMSCDACHLEGHAEGVLFAKTRPLRIYRVPTVRGSRETPPYFNPATKRSLAQTAEEVGGRNRFHNPSLTLREIEDLTLFSATITTLPNPFVGPDGAPVERLALPDGRQGEPRRGLAIFEGRAGCAGCHPAPHFTTDQDAATRDRAFDVGSPRAFPLRVEMQAPLPPALGPPSLLGVWDIFPLLTTGTGGFAVGPRQTLEVRSTFPLREVVEAPKHGSAAALPEKDRDDLLAYLLSL